MQLTVIFIWASIPIFQLGWQGTFEGWAQAPNIISPLAHAMRDPHFGQSGVQAFALSASQLFAIRCTTGMYQWLYTLGFRSNGDCLASGLGLSAFGGLSFVAALVHATSRRFYDPGLRWHANVVSWFTHNASGLVGVGSLAWAGHIIHVALPASRGLRVGWLQLLTFTPSPFGLLPLFTGNWKMYAAQADRAGHLFGVLDPATGSAILTFSRTYLVWASSGRFTNWA